MKDTRIEWADDTVNPWWGCQRVSEACAHCYAEAMDTRFRPGGATHWGPTAPRLIRGERAIAELEAIARRGEREGRLRRVFIASMSDVFEARADLVEPRNRLWDALHRLDGRLIPMLLTKRPAVMVAWAREHGWPAGAWAGTTCETQERADDRIPHLLQVQARVRFVSCEPLLGPIDLERIHYDGVVAIDPLNGLAGFPIPHAETAPDGTRYPRLSWVIAGGESGPKARPSHPDWIRSLRDQCAAAAVPFFLKQWGEWVAGVRVGKHAAGHMLDGRTWDEVPT